MQPLDEVRTDLLEALVGLQLVERLGVLFVRAVQTAFDLLEVQLALERQRVDRLAQQLDIRIVIAGIVFFTHYKEEGEQRRRYALSNIGFAGPPRPAS